MTRPRPPARLWLVPILSTLAASATAVLPLVVAAPALPPFGLMVALGWRTRRPEMWPAWVALPLGLADDLLSGAALGTAMTVWTLLFLGIDAADHRPMWRDHWLDWGLATLALLFNGLLVWAIACFTGGQGSSAWPIVPPTLLAIILFPVVQRLCATLDRWRLRR